MFFKVLAAMLTADAIDRQQRRRQQLEFLRMQADAQAMPRRGERCAADEVADQEQKERPDCARG